MDNNQQDSQFAQRLNKLTTANEGNLLDQELTEVPALVFDRQYGLVVMCNHQLEKLVEMTNDVIVGHHVSQIFPYIDIERVEDHSFIEQDLATSSGKLFISGISIDFVTDDGETVLVKVRRVKLKTSLMGENSGGKRFENILALAKLSDEQSLDVAQKQAVRILRRIFHANIVNLYWVDDKEPVLRIAASNDPFHIMPVQLPSMDLVMLSKPIIWRKDFQLPTYLSTSTAALKLKYLISIPLGVGDGVVGLVLIGDPEHEPIGGINQMMELVRANLNTTISHFILTENLFNEIQQLNDMIELRNRELELLKDGIIVLSSDLTIIEVNQAVETLLGYRQEEIVGMSVEDILIGPPILYSAFQNALQGIAAHNMGTLKIHHRVGYPISVHMQIIPLSVDREFEKIIVMITDVSKFEEITLRTQQLEHRAILGEFISAFAHDVRNPINNMTSSLQLLNHQLPEDAPEQKIIGRLNEDCERLTQLMESFLSFSRLVDIRNFTQLDVGELLKKICSKWRPSLDNYGIQLFTNIPQDLPTILADKRALERVFVNLFSNAVEATEDNRDRPILGVQASIIENSSADRKFIQISISDNGRGIPEDLRDHIFEPFFSTKSEGTGLGLAISKQIVTAHQGSITVDTFPGGTVFNVKLPVMEDVDEFNNTGSG
jgi:PAS domain S-box-containing protein